MIVAQISDPHIRCQETVGEFDNHAEAHLQRAVTHLLRLPARPDVVLVTGDCVDTGHPREYTRFQELLRPLSMPVYVVPGNHDDRAHMLNTFGTQGTNALAGFVQYTVDDWPVRLIALDTNVPGHNQGQLCRQRLQWLEERLGESPTHPTLVFMHHPPVHTGLKVTDQIGLEGARELGSIITRYPQVELIVAGHLHMAIVRRFAGSVVMTCASTAHTLLPDFSQPERLTVQMEPPLCLLHTWTDSTEIMTYTSLIHDQTPVVELHDGTQWLS